MSGPGTLVELQRFVAVLLYHGFITESPLYGTVAVHMHVGMKLLSFNRKTVSAQPSTEKEHVPQLTTYRYTEYLCGTARNLPISEYL